MSKEEPEPAEPIPQKRPPDVVLPYLKHVIRDALRISQHIVIDCAYDSLMKQTELSGLSHQLGLSYGECTRARLFRGLERRPEVLRKHTRHIYVAGISKERTAAYSVYHELVAVDGADKWVMTLDERPLEELIGPVFRREELLYLSADAAPVLIGPRAPAPDEGTPYVRLTDAVVPVIGGLVDRNRHKGISLRRAEALGVGAARLDLTGEAFRKKVLTVNQVVGLLIRMINT